MTSFADRLAASIANANSLACVGLDPPLELAADIQQLTDWGTAIISQTHSQVCAFKPNLAFYEAHGLAGMQALEATLEYLAEHHPDVIVIGDAKRGDIGSTSQAHARFLLDHLGFDAVTLNPYLGVDALEPFLERADKGCVVLCRTSNPSADDFQLLEVDGHPLWQLVLEAIATRWNTNSNCLAVMGATRPADLQLARELAGEELFFLVPGVGAQGADLSEAVAAGLNQAGSGLIINSSRAIAQAPDPAQAAAQLRDSINAAKQLA